MHLVVQPIALVLFAIAPEIDALSLNLIHVELTLVNAAICELQLAAAVLLSVAVHAVVDCTVRPRLTPLSMLFIVFPTADVLGAIRVSVSALPIGFIVEPISLIDISISMEQLAFPICFALKPSSFVQ